ncbi:hypothetical protein R83H12_01150 [Fibrobacteria bacterium R8-3-H12]
MQPATIEKTQTKTRRASIARVKTAHRQTLQEWLASEVARGNLIAPTNAKPIHKPERPEPGVDWHSVYKLSRADL